MHSPGLAPIVKTSSAYFQHPVFLPYYYKCGNIKLVIIVGGSRFQPSAPPSRSCG